MNLYSLNNRFVRQAICIEMACELRKSWGKFSLDLFKNGFLPNCIPEDVPIVGEIIIAKGKVNLILRWKPIEGLPLKVGNLAHVNIKLENKRRGNCKSTKHQLWLLKKILESGLYLKK